MPVYEFLCKKCNKEIEKLVSVKIKNIKCKICGKSMKKIISLSNFHLKGSWGKEGYK